MYVVVFKREGESNDVKVAQRVKRLKTEESTLRPDQLPLFFSLRQEGSFTQRIREIVNQLIDALESEVGEKTGLRYLGRIPYDRNVEHYCFTGKSLLELPRSSLAYQSVKGILMKAGYG